MKTRNNIKSLSVNEILKDKEVKIILNLTIPKAHSKSLEIEKEKYKKKEAEIRSKVESLEKESKKL